MFRTEDFLELTISNIISHSCPWQWCWKILFSDTFKNILTFVSIYLCPNLKHKTPFLLIGLTRSISLFHASGTPFKFLKRSQSSFEKAINLDLLGKWVISITFGRRRLRQSNNLFNCIDSRTSNDASWLALAGADWRWLALTGAGWHWLALVRLAGACIFRYWYLKASKRKVIQLVTTRVA